MQRHVFDRLGHPLISLNQTKHRLAIAVCGAAAMVASVAAQPYEPVNGPRQVDPGWHALVGATVVTEPDSKMENATLVIRDGVIVSVEAGAEPPAGARLWDLSGHTIYPGLIESFAPVSVPAPDQSSPGAHWNAAIAAERSALSGESLTASDREKLRKMGFVVAHIAPDDGLLRGQTALVALGEDRNLSDPTARVINPSLWHAAALRRGSLGSGYPGSKMGAIALIRQTLADAQWWPQAANAHRDNPAKFSRPAPNDAVSTLADDRSLFFIVDDELDLLRSARLASEFDRDAVFVGSGTELRRRQPPHKNDRGQKRKRLDQNISCGNQNCRAKGAAHEHACTRNVLSKPVYEKHWRAGGQDDSIRTGDVSGCFGKVICSPGQRSGHDARTDDMAQLQFIRIAKCFLVVCQTAALSAKISGFLNELQEFFVFTQISLFDTLANLFHRGLLCQ